MERLKEKPFALLGINSDKDPKKAIAESGAASRHAIEGSTSGPIATEWNVHDWPTIYVIDAKGVIRYKNARGKQMDEAVETLLKEVE